MSSNSIQINRSSKQKVMESVYSIIKTRSGKITAKDIEKDLGSKVRGPLCDIAPNQARQDQTGKRIRT